MKRQLPTIPLALCIPSLIVLIAHYGFGMQTSALAIAWFGLPIGIIYGMEQYFFQRWAIRNRVTVDITRNQVSIQGEHFPFEFSSGSRVIGSRTELAAAIDLAIKKALFRRSRVRVRQAVHARVWTEGHTLTELENETLHAVLSDRFCFPVIEQYPGNKPETGMPFPWLGISERRA